MNREYYVYCPVCGKKLFRIMDIERKNSVLINAELSLGKLVKIISLEI